MGKYDKLGLQASSSDRWLVCTASPVEIVRRAAELNALPEEQKQYTIDGDHAHKLAELTLKAKTTVEEQFPAFEKLFGYTPTEEMVPAVKGYVEFVRGLLTSDDAVLFVEISAPLTYMPERVCRLDSLVVSNKFIDITDYKHGVGVSVEAEDNSQLIINAKSALEWLKERDLFEFTPKTLLRLKIYQPRARDKRTLRQWNISVAELEEKYAKIGDTAKKIVGSTYPHSELAFAPDDDTCRFCPLDQPDKGITCAARTGQMFNALPAEVQSAVPVLNLPDVNALNPESLAKVVALAPSFSKFLEACRDRAYHLIENGTTVPGFKIVAGRNARSWKDPQRAKELLGQKLKIDEYAPRELVSPAGAEKLLKKVETGTKYNNLLNAQIAVKTGNPTLVPESDDRPAIEFNISAADEFKTLDEAAKQPEPAASGGSLLD